MIHYRNSRSNSRRLQESRRFHRLKRNLREDITFGEFDRKMRAATDYYSTMPGKRNDNRMSDVGRITVVPFAGDSLVAKGWMSGNPDLSIKCEIESLKTGKVYTDYLKVRGFWPALAKYLVEEEGLSPEICRNSTIASLRQAVLNFCRTLTLSDYKVEISCDCTDFRMRGGVPARKGGYAWMNEADEQIKSPSCKHSSQLVQYPSKWTGTIAQYIAAKILKNPEKPELCDMLFAFA